MLSLIKDNKLASTGGVAIVLGLVLIISGSTVKVDDVDSTGAKKKQTLMALGGSFISIGVLVEVYDQYTRRYSGSASSSSQMSSSDLASFQERVAAAATNLRKSMEESSGSSSYSSSAPAESASELAARASAQICSFIQNYS